MKLLIFILLFSLSVHAQDRLLQVGLLTSSVVFNAVGDGLNSKLHYAEGHVFNGLSVASLLAIPCFTKVGNKVKFLSTYVLLRYGLFDQIYNMSARNHIDYEGGDNYYDRTVIKLPQNVIYGTKIISLGLVILLNK
jgi:hypothetical protein